MTRHVKRNAAKPFDKAASEVSACSPENEQDPLVRMREVVTSFIARNREFGATWTDEEADKEAALCMAQAKECLEAYDKKRLAETFARLKAEPLTPEEIKRIFLTPPPEIQKMSPAERRERGKRLYKEVLALANKL